MFDVCIIGGGITGTGIARDCAMRGLKTCLVEKRDIAGGATGTSMGMIHGGLRYILFDYKTSKISCQDAGYIRRIAPFLNFRIPFVIPIMPEDTIPIDLMETYFEVYDRYAPMKDGLPHIRLNREEALKIEPGLNPEIKGAITTDEWGVDTFRLACLNAVSAKEYGAEILTHTKMIDFIKEEAPLTKEKKVIGIVAQDELNGEVKKILAKLVVNAGGPWAEKIAKMAGAEVKLRPGKGVNIFFDRRLSNVAITANAIDGRNIAMIPHENTTMLGCTDDDFYGDLDYITANNDEVEYLLTAIEKVFPQVRKARIIRAMAGVRPTLFEWGPNEDKLSRDYRIFDHEAIEGIKGFISIAGGKLAMYRLMAEELTDLVCKKFGLAAKCRTHLEPLPGAEDEITPSQLSDKFKIPLYSAKRLIRRHGYRSLQIMKLTEEKPQWRSYICQCEPVMEAEIRYAIRFEWARTLVDVRRRTRLGTGPCQGARCALAVARILGEELGWSNDKIEEMVMRFLENRWKGKRPILKGLQLAQEEITRWSFLGMEIEDKFKSIRRLPYD